MYEYNYCINNNLLHYFFNKLINHLEKKVRALSVLEVILLYKYKHYKH